MISEESQKLSSEVAIGAEYAQTWNNHVAPFIKRKQADLFSAFLMTPSTEPLRLQEIRMQSTALEAMEVEFLDFINTCKMAQKQLELKRNK